MFKLKNLLSKKSLLGFAHFYQFMPMKIENKILFLACSSPLGIKFEDAIRVQIGLYPVLMLAKEADILEAQNKYYGLAADTIDRLQKDTEKTSPGEKVSEQWVENIEQSADGASVAKLVNQILLEAYKKRATDIHIEPLSK